MRSTHILPRVSVLQLGGVSYYVRERAECELPGAYPESVGRFTPATVIHLPSTGISLKGIQDSFKRFLLEDDVFQDIFSLGGYLVVQSQVPEPSVAPVIPKDVDEYLAARLLNLVYLEQTKTVAQGPYFAFNGELHQAWRLYPDDLEAFTTAVIPDDTTPGEQEHPVRFQPLHTAVFNGSKPAIAVPSRLYLQKSSTQPLAGVRITIKDNMHLAGVTTTLGSRAYTELYGTQSHSSEYVDHLIKNGAVVVGKTKMSAFAGSEMPPTQCIDYFPPWNPRGDGYQGPSGSSSGAAASIAGYPWVDISLCTDTTGSMRNPASSHGTWGHRATWNSLPMGNIVPSVQAFDAIGILARSSPLIQDLLMSSRSWGPIQKPTEIIYPTDWYPCNNINQQRMNEEFLTALENYIGVKHVPISLLKLWSQTAPRHLRDQTLSNFLYNVPGAVNVFDGYHAFDEFRRDYFEKFGRKPYLSPSQKDRWDDGASVSAEYRQKSMEKIEIFKSWFEEHVWKVNQKGTKRIMIVPQGRPGASYRDGTPGTSSGKRPYSPIFVVSMIGAPQVVVPIGQNAYHSVISDQREYAPIVATLIGPKGSDLTLQNVAQKTLEMASWQSALLTGRYMLHLGENTRNAKSADAVEL